ncbi:unnamed protein product, partial [marine sediment metagenome]
GRFLKCIFNGGGVGTSYGIGKEAVVQIDIEAVSCSFGQTTSHGTQDIDAGASTQIKTRDCIYDIAPNVSNWGGIIQSEDDNSTYDTGLITEYHGIITKDTGVKTGGAAFSSKMEPNANCGLNNFLTLNKNSLIEWSFIIKCDADEEKTITVKIRSIDAWSPYPDNTELFLEFWYLDHASDATRTRVASTQVLSHASDWVEFQVTFTPLQTGVAYGTVKLGIFEASKGCYVNGEAV